MTEGFDDPAETDVHGRKRELLRLGVSRGFLTWREVEEALPLQYLGDTEIEVFLFTCDNLGVELRDLPPSLERGARRDVSSEA